jgi:hypothetical protein
MANPTDLCTLALAQQWAGQAANATANAAALITSCSRQILSEIQRPAILPQTYSRSFDARVGMRQLVIPEWPLISISSLTIDGSAIPSAGGSPIASGYVIESQPDAPPGRSSSIALRNYWWSSGVANIQATYSAGYQTSETQTVVGGALTALQPYGAWTTDQGVTYAASGLALTNSGSTAPNQGQYQVSATGAYTFNSADNAAAVVLNYGFIPFDLASACAQWVAELLNYQTRIGVKSKILGGQETVSFMTDPVPTMVLRRINPYRRVAMW